MIGVGSDHAGYELKEYVKQVLEEKNLGYIDFGTHSGEPVDYPDVAKKLCENFLKGKVERAVLVCGTGIGMSIAANRYEGVRAALCHSEYTAEMSRRHNDSNVLVMGSRVLSKEIARGVLEKWLDTTFEAGRHKTRVQKLG